MPKRIQPNFITFEYINLKVGFEIDFKIPYTEEDYATLVGMKNVRNIKFVR